VPEGGRTIAGQFVAEGVSVSVPTYSLLHNKDIFCDPEEYQPQRWTDISQKSHEFAMMKRYHLPFSTGLRACIGRNIAYFEMTLVVAVLVHYFDFEFANANVGEHYPVLERLNANPDELIMIPRRTR
jgi:cytochrome P450